MHRFIIMACVLLAIPFVSTALTYYAITHLAWYTIVPAVVAVLICALLVFMIIHVDDV